MSSRVEAIHAPGSDLLELLVLPNARHTPADAIINNAVCIGGLIKSLLEHVDHNCVVLRVKHHAHRDNEATSRIHAHKPAIVSLFKAIILTRTSYMGRWR